MNRPRRIGIYGGTFDPIHRIHIHIGRTALESIPLDEVLFVVAAHPPHKRRETLTPVAERFAMVEAALKDEPGLSPSSIEIDRHGPSYTADTLETIHALHPESELYLILGEDSVEDFPGWHAPDRILQLARLVVAGRPGFRTPTEALHTPVVELPVEESGLSSTALREAITRGDDVRHWLPEPVLRHIREKELYRAHR
ncbi:MAG: nicotinate (nicotinamide) nucleotide adenylyltransferase [Candidatus Hydrogenedentes bacterium]|nr:nicotinate (nicotinamide) nucleotide adenylyltransferase [Candidatus Hydrogenedentota bacterium]